MLYIKCQLFVNWGIKLGKCKCNTTFCKLDNIITQFRAGERPTIWLAQALSEWNIFFLQVLNLNNYDIVYMRNIFTPEARRDNKPNVFVNENGCKI